MPRCTTCGETIRGNREQVGSRCPGCREPLYEEARDPRGQTGAAAESTQGRCATHPNNAAVGTCQRCGNYLCTVCWTRWRDRSLCTGCIGRALEAGEATPAETRAHLRQAVLAVVFGILAWLALVIGFVLIAVGVALDVTKPGSAMIVMVGFVLFLLSPLPSILGVGQGAAAIRARGNHMIMATIGLILSGVHVGIMIGLFTLSVLEN